MAEEDRPARFSQLVKWSNITVVNDSHLLQPDLLRWSEGNAAAMAALTLATAAGLPLWLLSWCGLLSFSLLLYHCRRRWTPCGRFGPANAVSLLRLSGVFVLPWLSPGQIAYAGLILLAMDGVDGWIARRTGLSGEFGEFFDKESDAFFMLMLCLLLYRLPEGFGPWILLSGLLRYLFVLFVKFARPPELKEQRTAKAGWISVFMTLTLLCSFAAQPGYLDYCRPLAVLMTLALAYSFAESLHLMYRGPRRRVQT
jgi:phosphatidylglycerophosphate synthase